MRFPSVVAALVVMSLCTRGHGQAGSGADTAGAAGKAAMWAMPPNVDNGTPMRELFEHPNQWAHARSRLTGIGYADHAFATYTDAELKLWFPQIKAWNLKLALEVGALKPWGMTGAVAFAKSRPNWDRFLADGAEIDAIALDEPMVTALGANMPMGTAVEETAQYIALVRKNYPTWKIGDVEPYPSIPASQVLAFEDALQARLRQMHVRGLDFFRLDVDWMFFVPGNVKGKDGWRGVATMEQQVRRRGLPFSLIYWSADFPSLTRQGKADGQTWERGILQQGLAYRAAGGRPDEYVVEDWVKATHHAVPENAPGTYMHSIDAFGARVLAGDSSGR